LNAKTKELEEINSALKVLVKKGRSQKDYPGAWYHVMNRGRRSESIFSDNW
jgi:ribosomal protein S12